MQQYYSQTDKLSVTDNESQNIMPIYTVSGKKLTP